MPHYLDPKSDLVFKKILQWLLGTFLIKYSDHIKSGLQIKIDVLDYAKVLWIWRGKEMF
jgi:hypothetical protein